MNLRIFLANFHVWTAAAGLLSACGDDGNEPTATTTVSSSSTTGASATSDGGESSGGAGSTSGATTSGAASSGSTSGDAPTGTSTAAATGTTGMAPTDGPGVLPGETGLDAFCRRYKECGGTFYADQQDCIDASHDYWGDCPSRQAALDAFGACMSEIDCNDWSPDAYNPGSTPCAQQWSDLQSSEPCA